MTNCLNCGAPFDVGEEKCSYCGTRYYDLSAIDLVDCTPIMIKIKTKMGNKDYYITQMVRPLPNMEIEMTSETVDIMGGRNERLHQVVTGHTVTTNLSFQAVPRKNGSLIELYTVEEKKE